MYYRNLFLNPYDHSFLQHNIFFVGYIKLKKIKYNKNNKMKVRWIYAPIILRDMRVFLSFPLKILLTNTV